jgi:hypothetical protein
VKVVLVIRLTFSARVHPDAGHPDPVGVGFGRRPRGGEKEIGAQIPGI